MISEFHYRIPWRSSSPHPGGHASRLEGGQDEFLGLIPFVSHPHARQIDFKASLKDPFEQLIVRSYRQRSQVAVTVIADLSASMGFQGVADKKALLAQFSVSVAWTVYRQGDRFGLMGGASSLNEDLSVPCRYYKGGVPHLFERLLSAPRMGQGIDGLRVAASRLGRQRSLVFLVSDFHYSASTLDQLLDELGHHDVVPIVLWDSLEYENLPRFGLVVLKDPETFETRRLLMRPSLREAFRRRFEERRTALEYRFRERGRRPFFLIDHFDPDHLTRYFLQAE